MGERKGQNKYYPPDFDPKKHGSLNGYHGTHALRERARKLDQGILIIRFEMPYNIWCEGCKAHIAMGVRYNAQKTKVGMYFTTPIHQFRMKCHLCDQHFEIRTDPKNLDYVILSGAKRKEQRWDMGENEQIVTDDRNDIKRLTVDPMFNLEHQANDKEKIVKLMPTLRELEEVKSEWKDDYKLNSMMRSKFRTEKKAITEQKTKDKEFLDKWNINVNLVKENDDDIKLASLYKYNKLNTETEELSKAEKRKSIETESIFDTNKKKIDDNNKLVIFKPKNSKDVQKDCLVKKLNKSVKEKTIETSGFGLSSNSGDKTKSDDSLKNIKSSLVVYKANKDNTEKTESATAQNKSGLITNALVSNDYGDSSNESGEEK